MPVCSLHQGRTLKKINVAAVTFYCISEVVQEIVRNPVFGAASLM